MENLKIEVDDIKYCSIDSAIKELQYAQNELIAQGANPDSIELDIELEPVPYEDRDRIACYVRGRKKE